MTYFVGRGERDLDEHLAEVDLIITGPHASAAFPAEMQPFVDTRLTKRLQYDFTDISTSPVTRRWAQIDPHVLYIEDPHPRAVRDANRPGPTTSSRVCARRSPASTAGPEGRPSLQGVDAVRPVTFGYLPVLRKPQTDAEWDQLVDALDKAGALGIDEYERVRDDLIERVIEAKLRRLATLDPATCTVAEWSSATHLDVMSMHDTMNHTARPDGAVCLERQPEDRLPAVVALSNHGDANGELAPSDDATLREPVSRAVDAPRPPPHHRPRLPDGLRRLGSRRRRLQPPLHGRPRDRHHRAKLRASNRSPSCAHATASPAASASACGRTSSSASSSSDPKPPPRWPQPGTDWVLPPDDRVDWLAGRLRHAHDLVRSWGHALTP